MERLKSMKNTLMSCIEGQMTHLESVDTKELGEAIDMIKDLSEAIYYCTITESMEGKEKEKQHQPTIYFTEKYPEPMMYPPMMNYRDMDRGQGRMYFDDRRTDNRAYYSGGGSGSGGSGGGSSSGGSGSSSGGSSSGGGSRGYQERLMPMEMRDYREGRSPRSRRMYMEAKETHQDKATQLKELDSYMSELSEDMVEMIENASPEEKQYLEKKLTMLANKIAQVK